MHRFVGRLFALSLVACGGLIAPETSSSRDAGANSPPIGTPPPTTSRPPTPPAAPPTTSPPTCADCVKNIYWAWDGGLVAYTDQHHLLDCSTYAMSRTTTTLTSQCVVQLGPCTTTADKHLAEALAALATSDMKKVLAGTTKLYGSDPRAFDGSVLRIDVNDKTIEVGSECPRDSPKSCTPVPAGLRALADALNELAQYEQDSGACQLR